jgi:DNA-binding NarL/FixJ family response regulator
MTRILIVDDHPLVVDGWRASFVREEGLTLAAVARCLDEGRAVVAREPAFDIAVIDVRLGDGSGFALLEVLDPGRTAAILVSAFLSAAYVDTAQRLGARGFLLKSSPMSMLLAGIRDVAAGGTAWDPAAVAHRRGRPWQPLSERERHVVAGVIAGRSNDEIGHELAITAKTVESHLTRLFVRFGLGSRGELLRLALEEGWLDTPAMPSRTDDHGPSAWPVIAH